MCRRRYLDKEPNRTPTYMSVVQDIKHFLQKNIRFCIRLQAREIRTAAAACFFNTSRKDFRERLNMEH